MRFLSALLYLYPASFRADYGREMQSIVGARMSETTGILPRLGLWADTVADVIANSVAVHFDILRQDLRYTARTHSRFRYDAAATSMRMMTETIRALPS